MLEVRIEELTKALERNSDIMERIEKRGYYASASALDKLKEDAEAPNVSTKSVPTLDTSQTSSPESDAVSYDDVRRITIAMSAKDKAKTVAALARFGVASAKSLEKHQWSEYVAYMQKVASGEVDPEASE